MISIKILLCFLSYWLELPIDIDTLVYQLIEVLILKTKKRV
ncbi:MULTISPECIES: hypothetical protein [Bacteria]